MYEQKLIPITYLRYLWESPTIISTTKYKIIRQFKDYEIFLFEGLIPINNTDKEIKRVFDSICEINRITNPLHVKQASYESDFHNNLFYVVVGNQRLCGIRVYNKKFPEKAITKINCLILKENDDWSNRTMAMKLRPNELVKGYDC